MNIVFGENKIKVNVGGQLKEQVDKGDDIYAVLDIGRRDSKWDGPGYRMNISLRAYEKRTDPKYGQFTIVKTNSDWMMRGLNAKFMTDVARRTRKTDETALQWVKERLSDILRQFLDLNSDISLAEEVI